MLAGTGEARQLEKRDLVSGTGSVRDGLGELLAGLGESSQLEVDFDMDFDLVEGKRVILP